ncbi:peptidoglycan-binding protein [Leptolyngbya sp. FACHB-261]|uniref:peptidoglycan-binding domain-containing protein n=1 Tax=Leptolyngbya sp. FACHB-261 TaxID=2692806 RepID=UPI00168938B8|nr:peptidoglycan-binding protein [Leptolyngbya sp. FACHB-261]MBD2100069.1 peptidoglycan-binding protein [Leptolyngbya sp. FACHB-261]
MEILGFVHPRRTREQLYIGEANVGETGASKAEATSKPANSGRHHLSRPATTGGLTLLLTLLSGLGTSAIAATNLWDSGSEVEQIQRALKLPVTGGFGPKTQQAVKRFQRSRGLTPDGIVGAQTRRLLLGTPATSRRRNTNANTNASNSSRNVSSSARNTEARSEANTSSNPCPHGTSATQKLLSAQGFYGGAVDGVCGPRTQAAIVAAQRSYGLSQDGVAGNRTIRALRGGSSSQDSTVASTPSEETRANASADVSSDEVIRLQRLLQSRNFYEGPIDGIYGPSTEAAVFAAQRYYGLTVDGVAGSQTLAALESTTVAASNRVVDDFVPSSVDVEELQGLLAERGFYVGLLDGVYGPTTRDAVARAQRYYGLPEDGVAGPQTIAALRP